MENERGGALSRLKELLSRLGKFRYALLVLLVGAVLMLLPTGQSASSSTSEAPETEQTAEQTEAIEQALAAILSQVDGAGRVEVLLSLDYGTERFYQSDEKQSSADEYERETVFSQAGSSERTPVVTRTRYPVYRGAIVVCEGAGSASVELELVRAVSRLTGLGSDKISVMKMK